MTILKYSRPAADIGAEIRAALATDPTFRSTVVHEAHAVLVPAFRRIRQQRDEAQVMVTRLEGRVAALYRRRRWELATAGLIGAALGLALATLLGAWR